MPQQLNITAKPQPLLATNNKDDRPLFMVLVILSFLATLTLLAVASGYRAAAGWHDNLESALTVQLKPEESMPSAEQAKNILLSLGAIRTVTILSDDYSASLLKPWLGNTPLPDDLPLPILLDVRLHAGQTLDIKQASGLLSKAGFRADIDDHRQWDTEITNTTRAAQILSLLALSLITIASIAAAIFATNAGITRQRRLMDVLHQVGASPNYTARLLSTRFAISGLKAGAIGVIAALLISILIGLLFSPSGGFSYFLPSLHFALNDIYLIAIVPFILSAIIAITSWRTVSKTLTKEIYP